METLIVLNVLTFFALVLAWCWAEKTTPVAQKPLEGLKVYKTKTGTILQCLQGGKSIAGRRHARGNWEPGDEKIYSEES